MIGTLVGLLMIYKAVYKTPAGRMFFDKLFLKLPIFGNLIQISAVARFCTIFGSLTRSGVPIMNSLQIVEEVAGNAHDRFMYCQCQRFYSTRRFN